MKIGNQYMNFIEDVFSYRAVWALEAIRQRRINYGWESGFGSGAASACIENGVPNLSMAMLIRSGLPSRKTAIAAINIGKGEFANRNEMYIWLTSNDMETNTENGSWPTPDTAEIWEAFRASVLKTPLNKWRRRIDRHKKLDLNSGTRPPCGVYRLEITKNQNAWICNAEYKRLVKFQLKLLDPFKRNYKVVITKDDKHPVIIRYGEGKPHWIL